MSVKQIKKSNWAYYGKYKQLNGQWKNYYKSGFTTMKSAKKAEEAFLLSVKENSNDITFDELVSIFNERSVSMDIKESTIVSYESYYNSHLKQSFGNKRLSEITPSTIEVWKLEMTKKKTPHNKPYSAKTINNAKVVLSSYLSYAERLGLIEFNPCRKVSGYRNPEEILKKKNQEQNFWEIDEFKQFISHVDNDYWNLAFSFLFETGVREGEMFALMWKDVYFDKGYIDINKSVSSKTHQGFYKITTPKNMNSFRKIDISRSLSDRLKKHLENESKKDGFVLDFFVFGDVAPLSRSNLARYLNTYIAKSGVKRITPHGFRHSHATYLIEQGIDDTLIANRLGHTVNILRKTYAHIYDSMRTDIKNKLDELYNF